MSNVRTADDSPPARRKLANLNGVLQLIWRERRISRAEVAQRTGLSRSTVSAIVAELLPTRLIAEVGAGPSRGGRRPIVLQFEDDAHRILGVDLGATHIAVALTDLRGKVLNWKHRHHPVRNDPIGSQALIAELTDACLADEDGAREALVGVGIAVPSPVDPRHPDRLSDVVMPAWRGHVIGENLRPRLGVPVLIDNDANLGALAEKWWGAGRDIDNFAYIKVATGVGSGHIIQGELYRGAAGVAGEIGHVEIDAQGPPCMCGLRGCLTTLVGAPALTARATALLASHPESALWGREVNLAAIEDAALAGDWLALQVVREAADNLGVAVAGMLNLMNPALVIIGGGLSRVGELLLEPLRNAARSRTLLGSISACEIVASQLGAHDIAVGAATLVLQEALADLRHFRRAAPPL